MWEHLENLKKLGAFIELGYVQYEARKKEAIENYYHTFSTFNMSTSCQ